MFLVSRFRLVGAIFLALLLLACDKANKEELKESNLANLDSRFPAVIGASRFADLRIKSGGYPVEFSVQKGERVVTGDLIARLERPELKSDLERAKDIVESAVHDVEAAMQRANVGATGRSVEQTQAALNSDKGHLLGIEIAIAEGELRAPFDGLVAAMHVKNMQTVAAGQKIVSLMRLDTLQATINVPASLLANTNIPNLGAGNGQLQAFVILEAAPNQKIEADFKGASLPSNQDTDSTSKIYSLSFEFEPPKDLAVVPGMKATVELQIETNQ